MWPLSRTALLGFSLSLVACAAKPETSPARVSEFGRYEGYSKEAYSEWVRESHYVTMRDGVRLAVDIIRPAVNGKAVDQKLPVVWTHSRYHRTVPPAAAFGASRNLSVLKNGRLPNATSATPTKLDSQPAAAGAPKVVSLVDRNPALQRLIRYGYVVVAVQVRGGGASFGKYQGLFSPAETQDAHDIMDWIVKQPWCDGNLGMYGGSYLGITQYMAASTLHPALKAIYPEVAAIDLYDVVYSGGIFRENMLQHWGVLTRTLDIGTPEAPVDEDSGGRIRDSAIVAHRDNWNVIDEFRAARFRDHDTPSYAYARFEPASFLADMKQSGVAAYHSGGWYDIFARDETLWFANWGRNQHLIMGPWSHAFPDSAMGAERSRLNAIEQHRWFDHWLKGIDNGVTTEAPIHYALINDPGQWTWLSADTWPPKGVDNTVYFFAAGKSGSVSSVNDGLLVAANPAEAGQDAYLVDLTTTTGSASRWDNAVGQGPMKYPDMTPNDVKAVTYTTAPLAADVTVTGSPVVTLYVTSNEPDGDFHALLEEIDGQGVSHYVSEGMLRASHRALADPSWNNLGLPWHRSFKADSKPLSKGEVASLVFDMEPTATVFNAGHRIRVTIIGADADNTEVPPVGARATIQIYRGADHASSIALPVMRK